MKLTDLDAVFVGMYQKTLITSYQELRSVEGAQGVLFVCPKCQNHSILCWFKNPRNSQPVPEDAEPKPGRWTFTGDTIDTLTLTPSVDISKVDAQNPASETRCYWHGFIQNGDAT